MKMGHPSFGFPDSVREKLEIKTIGTADYKRLRVKMKNIRFLPNATTKPTQHFEHEICIINLTIIIAVHLSVYCDTSMG